MICGSDGDCGGSGEADEFGDGVVAVGAEVLMREMLGGSVTYVIGSKEIDVGVADGLESAVGSSLNVR